MWMIQVLCAAVAVSAARAAVCVPFLECQQLLTGQVSAGNLFQDGLCKLDDGSDGVRCEEPAGAIGNRFGGPSSQAAPASQGDIFFSGPTDQDQSRNINVFDVQPLKSRFRDQQKFNIANSAPTNAVVEDAKRKLAEVDRVVQQISQSNINAAQSRSPEELQLAFGRPQAFSAESASKKALQDVQVLTSLKESNDIGSVPFDVESPLFGISLQDRAQFKPVQGSDRIPDCQIPPTPSCFGADKYRRHNGECNNEANPRMGMAVTAFSRFFPNEYEDGIWQPRKSQLSRDLPSARLVSERVVNTSPSPDQFRSLSVMQFGQFINHDMISTPTFRRDDGSGLNCCNPGNKFPDSPLHPTACNPIAVPENDPFYAQFGRTCMNSVRSLPAPFEDCVAGPVSQLNQVSQYLDMSNVYGSSDEDSNKLRARFGGRIKTSNGNLLPEDGGRFFSGEGRLNENPGLAFMHTIWTREHNRVADELSSRNPGWDDEKLYQEARRITIGEYQNVVFNEYVPTVLGFRYASEHGLNSGFGLGFSYSNTTDPRITAEFSTAAFRFGHSQVHDAWVLRADTGRILETIKMEDAFFRADLLRQPGFMKQIARSLTRQQGGTVGPSFSASVHEKLFAVGAPSGLDLIALNIQRGRDHGLPTYLTALENCIERTIDGDWDGLAPFFEPQVLNALRNTYETIHDIDLYIGGVTEKRKPGALVGEVFQCIIGEQFFNIRYGDRFFYDNGGLPNSFTFSQVRELQQASWARILCDNIEDMKEVQPLAMWQPSAFFNRPRNCDSFAIPRVDLAEFGEGFVFSG